MMSSSKAWSKCPWQDMWINNSGRNNQIKVAQLITTHMELGRYWQRWYAGSQWTCRGKISDWAKIIRPWHPRRIATTLGSTVKEHYTPSTRGGGLIIQHRRIQRVIVYYQMDDEDLNTLKTSSILHTLSIIMIKL